MLKVVVGDALYGAIEKGGHLPFWAEKGWCWGAVGLSSALGAGLMAGGAFLIRWMRSLVGLRIQVGTNGPCLTRKGETRCHAWSDIVSVEETHIYEPMVYRGALKQVLPKRKSESFLVHFNEGEPLDFEANSVRGHVMLADMIKKDTDKLGVPWRIVEIHN